jgi:hypothetical protein
VVIGAASTPTRVKIISMGFGIRFRFHLPVAAVPSGLR